MVTEVKLTRAQIVDLAQRALMASGAEREAAAQVAEATAAAEWSGMPSHGLLYVPVYCEHLRVGKINAAARPTVDRPKPALLTADADSGFAHPAIDAGFRQLVPLARETGIAALAVRNSYNCGLLGHHVDRLARDNLLAIGFTNAPASIAPHGGNRPVVGTNPIAVSVPDMAGGVAVSIDQSASVIAKSEVLKHAREGREIPLGWALDPDGKPTRDAAAALKGSMAPSGGHKGFGLGLIVELFAAAASGAVLSRDASPFSGPDGGPPRTGQFFIALDADAASSGAFAEKVGQLVEAIETQPGAHVPGARKAAARTAADAQGTVSVNPALHEQVARLADAAS